MLTRTEEAVETVTVVRIRFFSACLYRHEWKGRISKIWLLGVPVYRAEVRW
jgi:hypothetical protein